MLSNNVKTTYYDRFKKNLFEGSAEVIDIILDKNHPDYDTATDIGLIKFRFTSANETNENANIQYARPLCPYFKIYPIKTEIVNIFSYVSPNIQNLRGNLTYYYQTTVNAWELLNLNSIPGASSYINPDKYTIDFDENPEIKGLMPYQGDVIFSGRYGQYIRFSSSNTKFNNTWSTDSTDNSPIAIYSTTTQKTSDDYRIEDINKDDCSIWFTTKQKIPVKTINDNFKSYKEKPKKFNEYKDSQIIISSNRLLFLSRNDSIFLNSNKSISLSAKTINVDANDDVIIESPAIHLGNNSTESGVLGNKLVIDILIPILTSLTTIDAAATGGSNATTISQIAAKLNGILSQTIKLK